MKQNKKKGLDSVGIVRDARLDVSIPSTFSGQRGYEPRFLNMAAPHLNARGTSALLNNALLSARLRFADYTATDTCSGPNPHTDTPIAGTARSLPEQLS